MNKFLGALGDIGLAAFGIFVMAVVFSRFSDEQAARYGGAQIKKPNYEIGQQK